MSKEACDEKFEVSFKNISSRQKDALILLFKRMFENGKCGHTEVIGFMSDGDGDFRPDISINGQPVKDIPIPYIGENEIEALERLPGIANLPIDFYVSEGMMHNFNRYYGSEKSICDEVSAYDKKSECYRIFWTNNSSEYSVGDIHYMDGVSLNIIPPGYKDTAEVMRVFGKDYTLETKNK